MKTKYILLAWLFLAGTGCSNTTERTAFEQNIQYHYFEVLESHAYFLMELDNIGNYNDLSYFVRGYTLGQNNRDTYKDVELIAYKQLENVYSKKTITRLKDTVTKIEVMISKLSTSPSPSIIIAEMSQLGLKIAPADQEKLSLYNILVYHSQIKELYTESEINLFINELEELIVSIEKEME